jgi:hypothetical protein
MTIASTGDADREQNGTRTPTPIRRYVYKIIYNERRSLPASDRILSVQSHVAFGYVGGKAAVFPLQCMGYDVDVSAQYVLGDLTQPPNALLTRLAGRKYS